MGQFYGFSLLEGIVIGIVVFRFTLQLDSFFYQKYLRLY